MPVSKTKARGKDLTPIVDRVLGLEKFTDTVTVRKAPRITKDTPSIACSDDYCWKVANLAYSKYRLESSWQRDGSTLHSVPWNLLSVKGQDAWFWIAKAVMDALDTLE